MTDRLDEIKARAEGATSGPWVPYQPGDDSGWWWVWQESKLPYYGGVAHVEGHDDPGGIAHAEITDNTDPERERLDAEFIAHAREDIPWLVAEVERLREYEGEYNPADARARLHAARTVAEAEEA